MSSHPRTFKKCCQRAEEDILSVEMNYCRRCGKHLLQKSEDAFICENNHSQFISPSPGAGIFFVTRDRKVVLSRRGIDPGKGKLDPLGGFINQGESAVDTIVRELREETGLSPDDYEPVRFLCTAASRYFFEGENRPVVSVLFWSRLKPHAKLVARDDVAEIVTLPLDSFNLELLYTDDAKAGIINLQKIRNI